MGPFIRSDLLEKHSLAPPETIDQWEKVLSVFYQDPDIDIPLIFYGGNFQNTRFLIGSFGISWGFFLKDDHIVYGPLEKEFLPFLTLLTKWFQNGWIDPGVVLNNLRIYKNQINEKKIGIYVDYITNIQNYQQKLNVSENNALLIPLQYPRLNEKTKILGHRSGFFIPYASAYISSKNSNPEETMRVFDYFYSNEGSTLFNFGVEGESYNIVNGMPQLSETIFTPHINGTLYKYYLIPGPYNKIKESFFQSLSLKSQRDAARLWSDTDSKEFQLPLFIPDKSQSRILADINQALNNYIEDMLVRFITGNRSLDEFETFIKELLDLNVETALKIYNEIFNTRYSG